VRAWLTLLVLALTAGNLAAQTFHPAVGASAVAARVQSELSTGTVKRSGTAVGAEGRLSRGRWLLGIDYLQGAVSPDSGSAPSRDLVEGAALLGFQARDWLTLKGGVRARAYGLTGGTERWLFWVLGARAERTFIGSAVNGYAELWRTLSAGVNVPERFGHAQGGEVGMIARPSRAPLQARLAYRIDHAVLGGGTRLETVDAVVVGLVVTRR